MDLKEKNVQDNELQKRLFKFAVDVIRILRKLGDSSDLRSVKFQLTKSAGSSGANYEEAQAAESRIDFGHKVNISLKEMRESNYWLRLLAAIYPENIELKLLVNESRELKLILGSIRAKLRAVRKDKFLSK